MIPLLVRVRGFSLLVLVKTDKHFLKSERPSLQELNKFLSDENFDPTSSFLKRPEVESNRKSEVCSANDKSFCTALSGFDEVNPQYQNR